MEAPELSRASLRNFLNAVFKRKLLVTQFEESGIADPKFAFIINSDMPFEDVLFLILDELKLLRQGENLTKLQAVKRLTQYAIRLFARGGNLVIVIDEAQNFSRKTLESLRMISNLETSKHKLFPGPYPRAFTVEIPHQTRLHQS